MPDMNPVSPTGINAAGKVALYFVPALADPAAPKLTEVQAGINLSMIAYAWDPNGTQEKQERYRYGSKNGGNSLGTIKYEAGALEYDYDPQAVDVTTGDYKHYSVLAPGTKGFILDRRGLAPDVAPAAAQYCSVFPVVLGERLPITVDPKSAGETLRVRQELAITGDVILNAKIAV